MLSGLISAYVMIVATQVSAQLLPAPPIKFDDADPLYKPISQTVTHVTRCRQVLVEVYIENQSVTDVKVGGLHRQPLLDLAQEHLSRGRVADVVIRCTDGGANISLFTSFKELIISIPVHKHGQGAGPSDFARRPRADRP